MAVLSYKENTLLALQHKEPEFLPMITDVQTYTPLGMDFVCEYTNIPGVAKDWFGQSWTYEPKIKAANPTPGIHLVPDITRWKEYMKFPDLSKLDWEGHAAVNTKDWDRIHKLTRINDVFGPWERMFSVMEFQEALCALIEEPEACYDFFGAVADHKIRMYEYIIKYYKPDILCMHDDYGHGKGMFMSPDTWRALLKPHLQRIIDMVTSMGVLYEHHCCGYFAPILDEIADMGCTASNTMHVSNHPAECKKKNGHKMCYIGGFDTQYMDGLCISEEDIRRSVRKTLDEMAPGGSYIALFALKTPGRNAVVADEIKSYSGRFYSRPRPDAL